MELFDYLVAKYPSKNWEIDTESKMIGFLDEASGIFIVDPTRSTCGRFESEDWYGLTQVEAESIIEYNNG